jgi:hypothetical protein
MASLPGADSGLIPLVIGVTGHRDLREEDRPALTESLRRLFHRLATPQDPQLARRRRRSGRANRGHGLRSPTPLLLLTPLAEGADRLVAHVALEFGARLVVPLPVPRAEYEQDFATAESRADFAELLSPAHTVRVIDLPRVPAGHGEPLDAATQRLLQYTLAGAYVARHAQVFIALWDGEPPDKPGGTGDIVAFRRTGRFAALPADLAARLAHVPDPFAVRDSPLGAPETGTVHHIVTPRANRPVPAHAFAGRRLAPVEYDQPHQRQRYFAHLARAEYHMETFNIEADAAQIRDAARVARSAEQLYPAAAGADGVASLPEALVPLRNAFALADTLALRYQRLTYRTFKWMFGLAFLAVALFEGYAALAEPGAARLPWVLAYIALLAVADAVYLAARQRDVQNRFQDYRALAEGLRVQFFWRLSGLTQAASDFYLRQQRDELMWIAGAVRAWGMWTPPVHGAGTDARAADRLWIEAQRRYFLDARPRSLAGLARDRSVGSGLIAASVGCALVAAAGRLAGVTPRAAWVGVVAVLFVAAMAIFAHHLNLTIHEAADEIDEPQERSIVGPTERWMLVGVACGIAAIPVARAASQLAVDNPSLHLISDWHAWFVVTLVLTALAGTLLHAYVEKRAFGEHARRYRRMGNVFASAGRRLAELRGRGERPDEWRALILDLGREALAEHGDWVLLHRERPVEPPRVDL